MKNTSDYLDRRLATTPTPAKEIFEVDPDKRSLILSMLAYRKTPESTNLDEFENYLMLAAISHLWKPAQKAADLTALEKWTTFLSYAHLETDYEMPVCFYLACYAIGNQGNSFMPRIFGKIYNERPSTTALKGHCAGAIDKPAVSMKLAILSIDRTHKTLEKKLEALFIWMDRHTYREAANAPAIDSTGTIGVKRA